MGDEPHGPEALAALVRHGIPFLPDPVRKTSAQRSCSVLGFL